MRSAKLAAVILVLSVAIAGGALASGFENTGLGVTARGMAGAFRAVANDWTAAYYNPAGYAFLKDNYLGGNVSFIHNRHEITPNYLAFDQAGNGYGWGIANGQTINNFHKILNNPAGGLVVRLPVWGETVFGLSIYQPFDYSIAWRFYAPDAVDFTAYSDSAVALAPSDNYKNDLDVVAFQLTAGKEFSDGRLALGLGLQILRADLWYSDLDFRANPRPGEASERPRDRIPEFTENKGKGWGFGLRGGLLWKLNEKLNLGVSGYLPFDLTVKGTTYFTFLMPQTRGPVDLANMSQADLVFGSGRAERLVADFETDLNLPPSMSLGLAYQLGEKLTVALDAEYTLWSQYKGFDFAYSNFTGVPTSVDQETGRQIPIEQTFFTADLSNPTEWENSGKVALGASYAMYDYLTFLGGISADQSPSRSTVNVVPQFIDTGDKYGFSFGALFHINQWDWGIVTAYYDYPDLRVGGLNDSNSDSLYDNFPGEYKAAGYETVITLGHRF